MPGFLSISLAAKLIQVKNFTTAIINQFQNSQQLFNPSFCVRDQDRNSPYKISTQHQADK